VKEDSMNKTKPRTLEEGTDQPFSLDLVCIKCEDSWILEEEELELL